MIKGVHTPLVSETLFYEVQNIINTKRKTTSKADELKTMFFLKGYLICPICNRKLRGSFSRGSSKRYPYYHCSGGCKVRVNADLVNNNYDNKLQQLILSKKAVGLFSLILEDINAGTQKTECLQERKIVLKQLEEQESVLSKARRLFVADKLKFDDFTELKKEYKALSCNLKKELGTITKKLRCIDQQHKLGDRSLLDVFRGYLDLDVADKKQIVSLIPPTDIDIQVGDVSIKLSNALSKIFLFKRPNAFKMEDLIYRTPNFTDRKISVKQVATILAKSDIEVNDNEAVVVLDFLYVIAKTYNKNNGNQKRPNP